MAHLLATKADGTASMAYRSSQGKPWHGLGVPVSDDMTPEQMMIAAGVDWTVSKVDNYYEYNGQRVKSNVQSLIRDSDGFMLTTVGEDWKYVQNAEAFNFFNDFVEKGQMVMDTAGALKDGRIVWALAATKDSFELFNGDKVDGYLLFSNPHLYGKSIDVRFCATRVVCNNTITMALAEKGRNAVKINHRSAFDADRVKSILGISHDKMSNLKEAAEFLGSKRYTKTHLNEYYGEIFGKSNVEGKDLSRTAENVMGMIETQPGAEYAAGTFWQMFNSVTYATDHVLGRANDSRLESAWFGQNSLKKQKALLLALDMAKTA